MSAAAVASTAPGLLGALWTSLRGRVVVMGIGNPLRGDDAVGSVVARGLREQRQAMSSSPGSAAVTILDAEEIPESWLGPAVAARPDVVLLVDAVELGAPPGAAALLGAAELGRHALATHRTPLGPVADFLARETGAEVLLLGIQPGSLGWGAELSPDLQAAAADLVTLLTEVLDAAEAAAGSRTEAITC